MNGTIESQSAPAITAAPPAATVKVAVYVREEPLFAIAAIISVVFWVLLVVGTLGMALIWLLGLLIAYLFVHSAFISYLKGTAVEITPSQFPDLHGRIVTCCEKLGIRKPPRAYLLNGDGMLNAMATRFLGRDFLVFFSGVVDAMKERPEGLNFYIGHELGHIKRKHLFWGPILWPASVLPLLGAAYSRAREYTCDAYGLACCATPADAAAGVAVLAAGPHKWASMDIGQYAAQTQETRGFWMSFHELLADYPWLVKRMERINAVATHGTPRIPRRHLGAWFLAFFVPRVGGGGIGGGIVVVAMIGILAAVAIPAYEQYRAKAAAYGDVNAEYPAPAEPAVPAAPYDYPEAVPDDAQAELSEEQVSEEEGSDEGDSEEPDDFAEMDAVKEKAIAYFEQHHAFPSSLADLGLTEPYETETIASVTLRDDGRLIFTLRGGVDEWNGSTVIYKLTEAEDGIDYDCSGGTLDDTYRPDRC